MFATLQECQRLEMMLKYTIQRYHMKDNNLSKTGCNSMSGHFTVCFNSQLRHNVKGAHGGHSSMGASSSTRRFLPAYTSPLARTTSAAPTTDPGGAWFSPWWLPPGLSCCC